MMGWIRSGIAIALFAFAGVPPATAGTMTVFLQEDGDDVVFDFSGTIENDEPTFTGALASINFLGPANSLIYSLPGSYARHDVDVTGDPFGDGPLVEYRRPGESISTGDVFGFSRFPGGGGGILMLPSGHASGERLEGRAVFLDTSLDSIGAVRGRYVYGFGNNTLTLTVGSDIAPIPLPATGVLLFAALGGLALMARRRTGALVLER